MAAATATVPVQQGSGYVCAKSTGGKGWFRKGHKEKLGRQMASVREEEADAGGVHHSGGAEAAAEADLRVLMA